MTTSSSRWPSSLDLDAAPNWISLTPPPKDIVLVGAIDRAQSIPAPVHFAATQGALTAMTMTLGKELGPRGIRINLVALGLLDGGLSREISPKLVADYQTFSALRRVGKPEEAARAILWLALENTYMNGEVVPVNGGI